MNSIKMIAVAAALGTSILAQPALSDPSDYCCLAEEWSLGESVAQHPSSERVDTRGWNHDLIADEWKLDEAETQVQKVIHRGWNHDLIADEWKLDSTPVQLPATAGQLTWNHDRIADEWKL
uniref:Uncharacterized protein n=1 Tax=Magnetococcus massalia (strain MO-1) TaxID=451514 RepID=A0A1S7LM06_MAGMO|nr:Exported protein of unknown function [Candidatus Magnetococcus massalia]